MVGAWGRGCPSCGGSGPQKEAADCKLIRLSSTYRERLRKHHLAAPPVSPGLWPKKYEVAGKRGRLLPQLPTSPGVTQKVVLCKELLGGAGPGTEKPPEARSEQQRQLRLCPKSMQKKQ